MKKALVIVESPAKARSISRYLGDNYVVSSSAGHVRDLPTSSTKVAAGKRAKAGVKKKATSTRDAAMERLVRRMGIDPDKGWKAHYEIIPGKEKIVAQLRRLAADAETIYLATDRDREGEAIAWHLQELVQRSDEQPGNSSDKRYLRVVFNEITQRAVRAAFDEPQQLNMDRVQAQQARRFLDRIVGFMISPLLWRKVARGLSAGRVQSVAVRLLVERERAIRAFLPEEFWELRADCATDSEQAICLAVRVADGTKFRPSSESEVSAVMADLQHSQLRVSEYSGKLVRQRPGPPLITSTLQQAASNRLGFGVRKTMTVAQRLYEAGYITYMRTDSTRLSNDAIGDCREYIAGRWGDRYLPDKPRRYASAKNAQEAHEAIRPTEVSREASALSGMDAAACKLYTLIRGSFLACQMVPAEYLATTVRVLAQVSESQRRVAAEYELGASGRTLRFEGFLCALPAATQQRDAEPELPSLVEGEVLRLVELLPSQHFTRPPPRFTEASLVKELEQLGIGRPSTYASTISTIQERGYVVLKARRFHAEKIADIVTDRLLECFENLMDYDFTATMERELDRVAEGELSWSKLLDNFYTDFKQKLELAEQSDGGMRANVPTTTELLCPDCERNMQVRTASTGIFLGCSGYGLPEAERCRKTIDLLSEDDLVAELAAVEKVSKATAGADLAERSAQVNKTEEDDETREARHLRERPRCPRCDTATECYAVDDTRRLLLCGNYPDCSGSIVERGEFPFPGTIGPTLLCDRCGADMHLRNGRFGRFFSCSIEDCKNTRKILKNGEPAPPKMIPVPMPELRCDQVDDHFVLRDGAAGLFLAASRFPKNRETRAPFLEELLVHRDAVDPKYAFLFEAPVNDSAGQPFAVRFSRKDNAQYLSSDGARGRFKATYSDGRWSEQKDSSPRRPKRRAATGKRVSRSVS